MSKRPSKAKPPPQRSPSPSLSNNSTHPPRAGPGPGGGGGGGGGWGSGEAQWDGQWRSGPGGSGASGQAQWDGQGQWGPGFGGPGQAQWGPGRGGPGPGGPERGGPGQAQWTPRSADNQSQRQNYERPLHRRPSRLVEQSGPYAGMHSTMVREALRVMPTLAAQGPQAARNAPLGQGAPAVDRWAEPVHIGLPTETMVLQAPVRIAEFNTLIQKALDLVVVPIIRSLHSAQINKDAVVELFTLTDRCITPPLQNFIEQLSSRSAAARIVIDTTYYEQYLQRLRETTHGAHRQAVIAQLEEEHSRKIPPLPPAVAQQPSWLQRTWAYVTRRPPPQPQQSIAQMFPPGGPWGGVAPVPGVAPAPPGVAPVVGAAAAPVAGAPVGPIAPPVVAPAPVAAGQVVAAYIPTDREVAQKSQLLERRLRKNYRDAAEFVKNYRIPGQEGAVEHSPVIIKSLYCNILTVFVNFTESLIKTIAYRLRRENVLNRAESTYAAQQDALQGGDEVEITLNTVQMYNFLSRDQIDSLLEQLILIMVNYMNISPRFEDLIPLVSQIYSLATIYTSIADIDEIRAHVRLLTEVFSEHLTDLVTNVHVRAHNSMKKYVVNRDPWFASNGLVGKLGQLTGTLMKFVSEDKRVQVKRITDDANKITVVRHEQTRLEVTRETIGILSNIASPIFTALDRLMEIVDPTDFNETIQAADGTRRALRGSLQVAAQEVMEVGSTAVRTFGRLNNGLVRKLANIGASEASEAVVDALASLNDNTASVILAEVADQGGYQQFRAAMMAASANPVPISGIAGQSAAINHNTTIAPGYYSDFENFMIDLQRYSQDYVDEGIFNDFHRYINSYDILWDLNQFTYAQLNEIFDLMNDESIENWNDHFVLLYDLVNCELSLRPEFTENFNNNGRYNSNYAPSNESANNNNNNFEPEVFEGYYGFDDLTADLYSMVDFYDPSTLTTTATYKNWLTYVDNGFKNNQLPSFSIEQLRELLQHLRSSRITNDPLVKKIKRCITDEITRRNAIGNTESNNNSPPAPPRVSTPSVPPIHSAPPISSASGQSSVHAPGTMGGVNGFPGYYGWDDLSEELFGMMRNYNGFTQSSELYENWLGYVDRGFTHYQLPKFTIDQLSKLLQTIESSPMRGDELIDRIYQRTLNELGQRGAMNHKPAPAVFAPSHASGHAPGTIGGLDGFEGYYGWDDLTADLFGMIYGFKAFTPYNTTQSPLYQNWMGYVDRGYTHFQLPKFTSQQLNMMVETIDRSQMANDPLMLRIRQKTIEEMQRRGGGGGGGGGTRLKPNMRNRGNESSNVSSSNNGWGNFWNQNPVTYHEHITRGLRGNKTRESIKSAKKHRKRLQKRQTQRARSSSNSNSSIPSREKAYWGFYPQELSRHLTGDPTLNQGMVRSARKYTKKQSQSRNRTRNNRNTGARNTGARNRTMHRSRGVSTTAQCKQLEKRIKMALKGEKYPWNGGPNVEARIYFEHQGGIEEIRQCGSIKLLTAITNLKPNSELRRRMIATARETLRQVNTQNSYSPNSSFE